MAKRHFSEGTTELQQMLDFGNCPLQPTALLGEEWRNSEVPVSFSFPHCFPGLKMLFSLFFQPNLTHKPGSSRLSAGPVLQLCQFRLICQSISMAQGALPWARVRNQPPFRVFRGSLHTGSLQRSLSEHPGIPTCPRSPGTACTAGR